MKEINAKCEPKNITECFPSKIFQNLFSFDGEDNHVQIFV
jgi:hypothetical protein